MQYLYEAIEPTRLYIKRCSHCNLKYFGKTKSKNIELYSGSGVYWSAHLKKYNATSVHLWSSDWYYDTSITKFALKFSKINKIVESDLWANLTEETGLGASRSEEDIEKQKLKITGRKWWTDGINSIKSVEKPGNLWYPGRLIHFTDDGIENLSKKGKRKYAGRKQTEESNLKRSDTLKGKKVSDATRQKQSKSLSGRIFSDNHRQKLSKTLGDGRLKGSNNPGYGSKHMVGRKHYNNGIISVMSYECPPGFVPGRLKR